MRTGRESLCCCEVPMIENKTQTENIYCIKEHEGFSAVCLNRHVVKSSIYQYIGEQHYVDDHPVFEQV